MTLREKTYIFFEIAGPDDRASHYFDIFMIALILSNVVAIILETVHAVNAIFGSFFYWFELFSVIIFTLEYVLRAVSYTHLTLPTKA